MNKYRGIVFTRIRESCKSKLAASGNATWMQDSVKVPGGEVHALPAKRPLTRLATLATLSPRERAVLITPTRTRKDSPLPGARVVLITPTRTNKDSPLPRARAVLITPTRTKKDSPLPGERVPDEGGRVRGLFLSRWTLTEPHGTWCAIWKAGFCYLLERWLC
jgi:hypothetical protein